MTFMHQIASARKQQRYYRESSYQLLTYYHARWSLRIDL